MDCPAFRELIIQFMRKESKAAGPCKFLKCKEK